MNNEELNSKKQLEFLNNIVEEYVIDPKNKKLGLKLIKELSEVKQDKSNYKVQFEELKADYGEVLAMVPPKKLVEYQLKKRFG